LVNTTIYVAIAEVFALNYDVCFTVAFDDVFMNADHKLLIN